MLGLGGFMITRYMGAGIDKRATDYYTDSSFKNYELISSLGITDDDLAQIKETEGITDAEGVIRADGTLTKGELKRNAEIISITERISVPAVVDGRAPSGKDECMIGEDFAALSGLKIGDKVRLTMPETGTPDTTVSLDDGEEAGKKADKGKEKVLLSDEFTVTGFMMHPDYVRRKSVNTVVLPLSAYNKKATDGCYTHAFVKAEEPEGVDIFSDEFFEKTAGQKETLEELTGILAVDSADRAKKKAYDHIDSEWKKALAELEGAKDEIDANEAQLNSELDKARKDLEDAQKELDSKAGDAKKKIAANEKKINAAEKKIKAGEKELKAAKKKYKQGKESYKTLKEAYDEGLKDSDKMLEKTDYLLGHYDEQDHEAGIYTEEYLREEKELAEYLLENSENITTYVELAKDPDVRKEIRKYDKENGTNFMKYVDELADSEILDALEDAEAVVNGTGHFSKESLEKIKKALEAFHGADGAFAEAEKKLAEAEKVLEAKEKTLNKAKKELSAAKKALENAKQKMAAELNKYRAQIRDGWSLYYSKQAEYEDKLEEAKALLRENREEAEEKLAEAKAEVEKIKCKWIVLDRRGNAGYVDAKSNISAIGGAGIAFGVLFLIISAIVCFSTLAIIIEEQKKMVGTVKAFGFLKGEILGKYMVFGLSAAVIGCLAAIALSLGLSGAVLQRYDASGMYQFSGSRSVVTPVPTAAACIGMMIVCALATVIACTDILRSPASILMKGGSAKSGSGYRKKSSKRGGSLYSRLIVRNMLDDKTRVAISIIIVAFSTLLVGAGISMKLAYDGMTERQISDVHKYDIRVDLGDDVSEKDVAAMTTVLDADGASYTRASYETHLYRWGGKLDALNVLTGDPDELGKFFAIKDPKTGAAAELPDDGVIVQNKMTESYGITAGSEVPVMNSELDEKPASVKGTFQNYVGRLMVTSPEGYRATFGEDPAYNCLYVRAGEGGVEKIKNNLLAVSEDISFSANDEFASKFASVSFLYNLIVYMMTGIAIIMSFMILTNLANIFLNRKKTELTVMRINGFSIKQTKGYLAREAVVTTAAGLVLGVASGALFTPFIIKMIEQPDLQFIRSFHPVAWVAAVGLEVLFSIIINNMVFRKVKDLNFRDVA